MFLNLFKNLFRSSEDNSRFCVIARNDGERIEIIIPDPERLLCDELSEKNLYSVPDPAQGVENGMTLDLSVCYSIIQHHKGEIRFNRTEEKEGLIMLMFPAVLP